MPESPRCAGLVALHEALSNKFKLYIAIINNLCFINLRINATQNSRC